LSAARPSSGRRVAATAAAAANVVLAALASGTLARSSYDTPLPTPREGTVKRVVDGDTLLLVGHERVRLIGVDAPEIAHRDHPEDDPFGREAKAFTRSLVEGQSITLSFDPADGSLDRYGRTLAYVTLPDGRLLNLEIIRAGWAKAYRGFHYLRKRDFLAAEREARSARKGLWGLPASSPQESPVAHGPP
jgi:micrococcal nuclease